MRVGNRQINDDLKLVGELQDANGSDGMTHAQILSALTDKHTHDNSVQLALISDGDHDVISSGNPHSVTKTEVGLSNVPNTDTTDAINNEHTHANSAQLDLIIDEGAYTLKDGSRAFTGTIVGVTPTLGGHLTTKDYVDGLIQGLDWQDSVLDRVGALPDTGLSTGDRYILTSDNKIYEYNGSGWDSEAPTEGMATWVEDEDVLYMYNGSAWVKFGSTVTHNNLSGLQGGTTNEFYHLTSAEYTELNAWLDDVTLGSDGKIGIGGAPGVYDLNIISSGNAQLYLNATVAGSSRLHLDSLDNSAEFSEIHFRSGGVEQARIYANNSTDLFFRTGGTDRMNIDSNGTLNITQTGSSKGLFVTNTHAGGATAVQFLNDGTGHGLYVGAVGVLGVASNISFEVESLVQQDTASRLVRFHLHHTASTIDVVEIENDGTGHGLYIKQDGVLANNRFGLYVYTNEIQNTSNGLVRFKSANTSSSRRVFSIENSGYSQAQYIWQIGNGIALEIDNDGTNHGLYIHQDGILASGKNALRVYSNLGTQDSSPLVYFNEVNGGATGGILEILNGGKGNALYIKQTTVLQASKYGLYLHSTANQVNSNLMFVYNEHASATAGMARFASASSTAYILKLQHDGDGPHLNLSGDPDVVSPTDGDLWYTGSALNFRDGSTTKDLLSGIGGATTGALWSFTSDPDTHGLNSASTGYKTLAVGKYRHNSAISTLTWYASFKTVSGGGTAYIRFTVGGVSSERTTGTGSFEEKNNTLNVSGLTHGALYTVSVAMKNTGGDNNYGVWWGALTGV